MSVCKWPCLVFVTCSHACLSPLVSLPLEMDKARPNERNHISCNSVLCITSEWTTCYIVHKFKITISRLYHVIIPFIFLPLLGNAVYLWLRFGCSLSSFFYHHIYSVNLWCGLYGGGGIKDTIFAKTPGNNALFHSLMSADIDHLLQRHFTLLVNTKLSPTTAIFLCQVLEKNSWLLSLLMSSNTNALSWYVAWNYSLPLGSKGLNTLENL